MRGKGEAKTRFLGVVQFCGKMDLNIHKQLFGLGSDSASVMLGCRGCVSSLMKEKVPT